MSFHPSGTLTALVIAASLAIGSSGFAAEPWRAVAVTSPPAQVAPWTGIVLWDDHEDVATDAIQLEFSYVGYGDIVRERDRYDWAWLDQKLDRIAARGHQAVLRFHDTYVGKPTTVPDYIRRLPDYRETSALSEKKPTGFPDWSHPELPRFVLDFYTQFARRYDRDPRVAFLQTGFGLWSEYHIYDGPMQPGKTFPSREFQVQFLQHMQQSFTQLPWMISIDAASTESSPLADATELLSLNFGCFDDSFLCKEHPQVNAKNWARMGADRWQRAPAGGEFSYYNQRDQKLALSPKGPNGVPFEQAAKQYHLSFIIGSDQPGYQSLDRIKSAGRACGYRLRLDRLETDGVSTRGRITNVGIAPLYRTAFPAVGNVRATQSLQYLLPGQSLDFTIAAAAGAEPFQIASDALLPNQQIPWAIDSTR